MIEHRIGDLFEFEGKAIAHGCNTKGLMGAGVAKIVKDKFPGAHREYLAACSPYNLSTTRFLPGDAQMCIDVDTTTFKGPKNRLVFNLATQNNPGRDASYVWVERSFARMFELMHLVGETEVAIPRIGCGIANLVWHGVEEVIQRAMVQAPGDLDPNVIVYTHPREADKQW